jgi:hypothetical protein
MKGVSMYVQNIRGTSDSRRGKAWLNMWKESNGIPPSKRIDCAIFGCTEAATVGAHVTKEYTGMKQYIVPMCQHHNLTYNQKLKINTGIIPMPVNP